MVGEQRTHCSRIALPTPGRALHIREQERHGPGRQDRQRPSMTPRQGRLCRAEHIAEQEVGGEDGSSLRPNDGAAESAGAAPLRIIRRPARRFSAGDELRGHIDCVRHHVATSAQTRCRGQRDREHTATGRRPAHRRARRTQSSQHPGEGPWPGITSRRLARTIPITSRPGSSTSLSRAVRRRAGWPASRPMVGELRTPGELRCPRTGRRVAWYAVDRVVPGDA